MVGKKEEGGIVREKNGGKEERGEESPPPSPYERMHTHMREGRGEKSPPPPPPPYVYMCALKIDGRREIRKLGERGEKSLPPLPCWDLRLDKLSKFSTKIMIAVKDVESKHSTELKHQEYMISSSILGDPII